MILQKNHHITEELSYCRTTIISQKSYHTAEEHHITEELSYCRRTSHHRQSIIQTPIQGQSTWITMTNPSNGWPIQVLLDASIALIVQFNSIVSNSTTHRAVNQSYPFSQLFKQVSFILHICVNHYKFSLFQKEYDTLKFTYVWKWLSGLILIKWVLLSHPDPLSHWKCSMCMCKHGWNYSKVCA